MATMEEQKHLELQNYELFGKIDQYPWVADEEFQHGLTAILGSGASPEQNKHLTLRARCFYYARFVRRFIRAPRVLILPRKFGVPIDFAAYEAWDAAHGSLLDHESTNSLEATKSSYSASASSTGRAEEAAPYPMTFEDIVELISSGKQVPGIQEIPSTVLLGQASSSTITTREKPWERQPARRQEDR